MKKTLAALGLLVGLLATTACKKPQPGGSCTAGESICSGPNEALACQGGKYVAVGCNGPRGCTKFEKHANCDTSKAPVGASCMAETDEEYACTADKKRALVCKSAKFQLYLECRGPAGCSVDGRTVSCDTSLAAKGDPCKTPNALACGDDGKELFMCRDGKFERHRFCRGKRGCTVKEDAPSCDETLSLEGDPCGLNGQIVCSVDGQSELVCQGSTFMRSRACKKKGCVVTGVRGRPIECE